MRSSTPEDTALMLSNSPARVWLQRSNTKWINVWSISGIPFPRKRVFLIVCPVAFHGMKFNHFTWPYHNSPDRKLTTQRILCSPCYHVECDLIVFKSHNAFSFRIIRREEMHVEQRENDQVCSFLSWSRIRKIKKWLVKHLKRLRTCCWQKWTLGSAWDPEKHDAFKGATHQESGDQATTGSEYKSVQNLLKHQCVK